jgi:hypothetical protein
LEGPVETDGKVYRYTSFGETCNVHVVKDRYVSSNQMALMLIDADTGEAVATASVNIISELQIQPDQVLIQTWSENEGMLEFLVSNGIVEPTDTGVLVGHNCMAVLCRVLI